MDRRQAKKELAERVARNLLEFHAEHDQKDHGNWADWGALGSLGDSAFSDAEIDELVRKRRGAVRSGRGRGAVGFVDKILRDGKAEWVEEVDVDDLIATHGKNVMKDGKQQGRAFTVESDKGFLDAEPHEVYQAYQRGMGDLMFEGAEEGRGYLAKVMNEKEPLLIERDNRGDSYFYEIPGDKTHLLRVAVGQNRFKQRFIRTLWVEPVEGGRMGDIDVYNQKYWDRYRSDRGMDPQPYDLEAWYGDVVQPRRSSGGDGKYRYGHRT